MTAVLRSNTALLLLGSQEQSKAAMYYIMDYMTKDATVLTNVISLVHEARLQTIKFKSQAPDSNTKQRKATQFLTCINNKLATKSEIPGVMAAAALIGMKSKVCSHTFTYLYIEPAIAYVRFKFNHNDTDQENCTGNGHVSSDEEDCEIKDNVDTETDLNEKNSPPPNNGAGELFKINGQYTAIQQFFHYAYRGTHLRHLNLYEYICSIQVVNIITKKFRSLLARMLVMN